MGECLLCTRAVRAVKFDLLIFSISFSSLLYIPAVNQMRFISIFSGLLFALVVTLSLTQVSSTVQEDAQAALDKLKAAIPSVDSVPSSMVFTTVKFLVKNIAGSLDVKDIVSLRNPDALKGKLQEMLDKLTSLKVEEIKDLGGFVKSAKEFMEKLKRKKNKEEGEEKDQAGSSRDKQKVEQDEDKIFTATVVPMKEAGTKNAAISRCAVKSSCCLIAGVLIVLVTALF